MTTNFKDFAGSSVGAAERGERAAQIGAFCYRISPCTQAIEVLLVTSSRGRWILPKGWPIAGKSSAEVAQLEAWEEAGVKASFVVPACTTNYNGLKLRKSGEVLQTQVTVYPLLVETLADVFPEDDRRQRRWASVSEAAQLIEDPAMVAAMNAMAARLDGLDATHPDSAA